MSCNLYTVPGPVENIVFTITGTMLPFMIVIVWDAPTEPNGAILQYTYTITDTEGGSLILNGSTTDTFVNGLTMDTSIQPYTQYTLTVVAMTSAGEGESSSATVQSPETGKIWAVLGLRDREDVSEKYIICRPDTNKFHSSVYISMNVCVSAYENGCMIGVV